MNDYIIDLLEKIEEKCDYGDNMSALNQKERIFYVTQQLEIEVNNGGFLQFFENSSGDFAGELVAAYNEIGAKKTANICERAIKAIGTNVPINQDDRIDILEKMGDKLEDQLNKYDDEFYKYEEDLLDLTYQYVMNNKESFDIQ